MQIEIYKTVDNHTDLPNIPGISESDHQMLMNLEDEIIPEEMPEFFNKFAPNIKQHWKNTTLSQMGTKIYTPNPNEKGLVPPNYALNEMLAEPHCDAIWDFQQDTGIVYIIQNGPSISDNNASELRALVQQYVIGPCDWSE